MTDKVPQKLINIDPSVLENVVQQDQRDPSFKVTEWSARTLSRKGINNPDGLWLVTGHGEGGTFERPWSVVLKIIPRPDQEMAPGERKYWKREILVAESGWLADLPGPVRAPRFYRIDEQPDEVWLWMEYIESHSSDPWTLEEYAFSARQLGQWNAACMYTVPVPPPTWMSKQIYRLLLNSVDPEKDWQSIYHQKYISDDTRLRWKQFWTERESYLRALELLPQTFLHLDAHRRNLILYENNSNHTDELVVIDWAFCGIGPLGAELEALIGISSLSSEWPASAVRELAEAAYAGYLQGTREAGWDGDADLVRLGFTAYAAVYRGSIFPGALTSFTSPPGDGDWILEQFGHAGEDLYLAWLPLLYFYLDCADEARSLMAKLGLL